jgi:ParB family chromosome partitioning protein
MAAAVEFREINIDLIDDPEHALRETFDENKLAELTDSISTEGIIEPIIVKPRGDRFEIIAGHRRTLAARMARLSVVPCVIRRDVETSSDIIKFHENIHREDMNPVEEARALQRILTEHCGNDVDQLVRTLHLTYTYISNRLNLLRGNADVCAALERGEINFTVAMKLNQFPSAMAIKTHLLQAIATGANGRMVANWLEQWKRLAIEQDIEAARTGDTTTQEAQAQYAGPQCYCCLRRDNVGQMILIHVHTYCEQANLGPLCEAFRRG